jgi:tetratricopeptide (TPR) repeat protein
LKKAIQLDPGSAELRAFLSWPLYLKGDFAGSLASANEAIRIEPDFWVAHMGAGFAFTSLRQFPEAIAEFQKARTMNPESTLNLAGLAAVWAVGGERAEAVEMVSTLQKMAQSQYVSPMDVALVHTALGDKDRAFQWLDRAFDDQAEMLLFLKRYPPFAALRGDPRFATLLHRVGVAE